MPFIQRGPTHGIPFIEIRFVTRVPIGGGGEVETHVAEAEADGKRRLDDDVVVFRGVADESSGAQLKGLVALCIRESAAIRGISLVLQGVRRLQ